MQSITSLARCGVAATTEFRDLPQEGRRAVLLAVADALESRADVLLAANAEDVAEAAGRGRAPAFLSRLALTAADIADLVHKYRNLADTPSPVGETVHSWVRHSGIQIEQVRAPIGVVGLALESRPAVIAEAAALCIKIGNALLVAADSVARRTSLGLANAVRDAGIPLGLPTSAIQVVIADTPQSARELARAQGLVDIVIPRGSPDFVADITRHATVPVLKHLEGDTHVYLDASAPPEESLGVVREACLAEPDLCTSANTLLVHTSVAEAVLPALAREPAVKSGACRLCPDARAAAILGVPECDPAQPAESAAPGPEEAFPLRIELVDSVQEAVERINRSGDHIADTVLASDDGVKDLFLREVDSACVCVNVSPLFADGNEFGMGGDIGFSTDKIHARGPLGLEALTSLRYQISGKYLTKN